MPGVLVIEEGKADADKRARFTGGGEDPPSVLLGKEARFNMSKVSSGNSFMYFSTPDVLATQFFTGSWFG